LRVEGWVRLNLRNLALKLAVGADFEAGTGYAARNDENIEKICE
jgi:hypothetical protein